MALQITAALLQVADPVMSTTELADRLEDEKDRLRALRYDDGSAVGLSVEVTFGMSYRRLGEASKRVFRLLPVNPGPDVSTATVAKLADLSVIGARDVLGGLARAHLIESAASEPGRWRMHDLVRLYAQQLSDTQADSDGREQARDRLLDYYTTTADAADDHMRALPGVVVPAVFDGRTDALAWLDAERPNLVSAVSMAAATGRDHVAIRLPPMLSVYLDWRRRFDDWQAVFAVGVEAARRSGDQHGEAIALGNLGNALLSLRRFEEAITVLQDGAAMCRTTGDRQNEGAALDNLGSAMNQMRRFDDAITARMAAAAEYFRRDG